MHLHLLSLNYAPEQIGIGPYSAEMCAAFAARGARVTVSAAKPFYPAWRIDPAFAAPGPLDRTQDGVAVRHHPLFVPRRPTGPRRVLHHLSFAIGALPHLIGRARRDRPDVVMAVAPSLIASMAALVAARLCGARTWLHVQDFEVEAAFATGLIPQRSLRARIARAFERSVMRRFDVVSSISPQMCARLAAKGIPADRIVEFRNWADIAAIRPLDGPSPFRREFGIATPHVALYSGNIANKQGIDILADVARRMVDRRDLTFVICGDGPNLPELRAAAADLPNIRFFPLQPRDRLNDLVGLATVHLLPQKADAADLVLPSKLTNMLASGRPVIATAAPGTGLADEVIGAGLIVPPGDAAAFARAIETLLDDPALAARLGAVARTRAEDRWDRSAILARVFRRIAQLAGDPVVDSAPMPREPAASERTPVAASVI